MRRDGVLHGDHLHAVPTHILPEHLRQTVLLHPFVGPGLVRDELLKGLAKKESKLSEVSRTIARKYGLSKNKVYEEALKLKAERLVGKD